MVRSMTGYGKGEAEFEGGSITVEVRTVNHRFMNFSTRLPHEIKALQHEIEKDIREVIKRGSVTTSVTFDSKYRAGNVALNTAYLESLYQELARFRKEHGIPGEIDINSLLNLPEAVVESEPELPLDEVSGALKKALGEALEQCVRMRTREGEDLREDILGRMNKVRRKVEEITERAEGAAESYFAEAKKKVGELLRDTDIDDSRWLNEVAIMAEKMDFAEELTRMQAHIGQFEKEISEKEEAAKKLKFLLQEIHREANTMGSKASDIKIINRCLDIKEGVEKIREQVANLE
jgi:uncharacterized protein (TIGR00255 family)